MNDAELLAIIAQAEREGWTELDLSGNDLKRIPPEISKLLNVKELNLCGNQIDAIPDAISQLQNLQKLNLSRNQISLIPDTIFQIINLKELSLYGNQIKVIPKLFSRLINLQQLFLYDNQISVIPDNICQLLNLQYLYLSGNQISVIPDDICQLLNLQYLWLHENRISIIPAKIACLSNLQSLFLFGNQISFIPDAVSQLASLKELWLSNNQIRVIPDALSKLSNLQTLDLRDNPLPIPPEILNDYENPKAIFDFWLERERQPLNEAKVILVGQGTVGKTSLVKRLLDNQFDAAEHKTNGINIRNWQVRAKNEQVKLRVWDFGGQEIMHATHQFFLTERSLYLLVINTREDELANRIEYWLKLIDTLGKNAPVIIVGNKIDDHPLDLDRHGLQTKYPNIKAFIGTSCSTGRGIAELKQQIIDVIATEMPHVFDPIPVKWLDLKTKLEQDDRDYITYQEYAQKCIDSDITRESSQKTLVRLLHELGIILNFADDRRLKDTNVLNPEWVTIGAYKVINDNLLMTEHKGVLHWQDAARIFQPKSSKETNAYPTEESRKFILRMMEKFELCFPMESANHQEHPDYLIPDLLPKEQPETGEWKECLNFEYHYDKVLPNSVISRFIVKSHDLIARTQYRTYWRTGVILANKEGNKAYVKADLEDAKIFIHISGNSATRRSFLSIIRRTFDQIHDRPRLTPDERVCLPDKPKDSVSYNHLLSLEKRGKTEYSDSDRDYNIRELLDGISSIEDRRSRYEHHPKHDDLRGDRNPTSPVTVIISNQPNANVMSQESKYTNDLQGANIGNFANEVKDNARQQASNFTQTSGASVAELLQIISNLRQTATQFPQEIREDVTIDIDDVEIEIQKPEPERNLPKLKKRLLALLAAVTFTAAPIAGMTDFVNNVMDIGNKLGIGLVLK
jgi:internalin A